MLIKDHDQSLLKHLMKSEKQCDGPNETKAEPLGLGAVGPGILLVHDNVQLHAAQVCRQFLDGKGIHVID